MLVYNPVESENYSFNIYRETLKTLDIEAIFRQIIENDVDIAIIRLPSKYYIDLYKLSNLGFDYIIADTLVEYTVKLNKGQALPAFNSNIEYILVNNENKNEVYRLLEITFTEYSNHYKSNPFLKRDKSNSGYKKWIDTCISNGVVYLVKYQGNNAAFFACQIDGNYFIAGLGGVDKNFEGCGIYLDALKKIPYWAAENGLKICRTGTQIQNHVVQKQWNLAGWTLSYSWITIHINSFLNKCQNAKKIELVCPSKLNVTYVSHLLDTHLCIQNILSSKITIKSYSLTKKLYLYISDNIPDYDNNTTLIVAKITNSNNELICISQTIINVN